MAVTQMYLHKSDLEEILEFITDMNVDVAHITYDNSSGIGAVIKVSANSKVNGHDGEFTKTIADETSW